jgi:hypothetical protein
MAVLRIPMASAGYTRMFLIELTIVLGGPLIALDVPVIALDVPCWTILNLG